MADYHVLSNINQNYLFYFFVTYQSILDSLEDSADNVHDQLIFHVMLDPDINIEKFQAYSRYFLEFNAHAKLPCNIVPHRMEPIIFQALNCETMERNGIKSFTTYYRLMLESILPAEVKRVLYLDVDIIVYSDIRLIFKQNPPREEILYAASDPDYLIYTHNPLDEEPEILFPSKYPNVAPYHHQSRYEIQAGVLLINLEQWRKHNITKKCLDFAKDWHVLAHDQDLLSAVCKNQVSYLSWGWNVTIVLFWAGLNRHRTFNGKHIPYEQYPCNGMPTKEELIQLCTTPHIVHFIYDYKPWNRATGFTEKDKDFYCYIPHINKWLQNYSRLATFFNSKK